MHFHCEIILPPTDDIKTAVAQIMAPFDENLDSDDENASSYRFWDWFVIGGRWSGAHIEAKLGEERLHEFRQKLIDMKVTVSGLQAGKQELSPKDQIPMVDALWRDMFPESGIDVCPLFNHYNDQYSKEGMPEDVCLFSERPDGLTAERVIFAINRGEENGFETYHMLQRDFWNGYNHVKSAWDGTINGAVEDYKIWLSRLTEEAREKYTPKDDWLVVTVDYHS